MAVPALRIRIAPKFPAKVQGSGGISTSRSGGVVTIRQDWSAVQEYITPPDDSEILIRNPDDGQYYRTPLDMIDGILRPAASEAEAEAGADNTKAMTPLRSKQSVETFAQGGIYDPDPALGKQRTLAAKAKEDVSILDADAINDPGKFTKALNYGGLLKAPPVAFSASSRVNVTLSRHTKLRMDPDASVVLGAGIGAQAYTINGADTYTFDVEGGTFDSSAVTNPGIGGDVGSVFDLNNVKRWSVRDVTFKAGTDFLANKGDSAIDAVSCGPGIVEGCTFIGWPDCAIYLTGGNSASESDDGGPTTIIGNYFNFCSVGVAVKRKNRNIKIIGNHFNRNFVPIGSYEVGTGLPHPGESFIISGNEMIDSVSAAIEFRGGNGKAIITGNRIEDFGYDLSGSVVSNPSAIQLKGSKFCLVNSNIISLENRSLTSSHVGVQIANQTVDGTLYTATKNNGFGNVFRNVQYSIFEGSSVGPNKFLMCDASDNVPGNFILTNANSEWSGAFSVSNFRWYRFSTLIQNI